MTRLAMAPGFLLLSSLISCGDGNTDNPFEAEKKVEEQVRAEPKPGADTDEDGWLDELEAAIGTDHLKPDVPCASTSYSITESFRAPRADFVFIVDSSGSMAEELPLIKNGLQFFFGPLLSNAQLDFHVVFIGSFGATGGFCLNDQGAGGACRTDIPSRSDNFLYYDKPVGSANALEVLLNTYATGDIHNLAPKGWSSFLRDDAKLVITVITDDNAITPYENFTRRFQDLDPERAHHTAQGEPDYIFHSIIGIADAPGKSAWLPTSSVQTARCFSAPNSGLQYQRLSVLTGGLRFPICRSADYGSMLEQSARVVFDEGYIPCVFPLPEAQESDAQPGGERLSLQLERANTSPELLTRVATSAQCEQGDFYLRRTGFGSSTVYLCPQLCTEIQQSSAVTLKVATSCTRQGCLTESPTYGGSCDNF